MICAALVHAGKFDSLEAAHVACKEKRKVSNIFTSPLQGPMHNYYWIGWPTLEEVRVKLWKGVFVLALLTTRAGGS